MGGKEKHRLGAYDSLIPGVVQDLANASGDMRAPEFLLLAQSILYTFHTDNQCPLQRSRDDWLQGTGHMTAIILGCVPAVHLSSRNLGQIKHPSSWLTRLGAPERWSSPSTHDIVHQQSLLYSVSILSHLIQSHTFFLYWAWFKSFRLITGSFFLKKPCHFCL